MNRRRLTAALGATALTAAGALLLTSTSPAAAEEITSFDQARQDLVGTVDDTVVDAMVRDFDLTVDGVYDRLATDAVAADIEAVAAKTLDAGYAGTWVEPNGTDIVVAVTDPADIDDVEALGAEAQTVTSSLSDLDAIKADLDAAARADSVPDGVHSWAVDVADNTVTITASDTRTAIDFATAAGLSPSDVDVELSADQPQPLYNIRGGDAFYINNSGRCSVGFSVTHSGGSGFVTAGHCGSPGASVSGYNQVALGTFQESTFPGSDYAWVAANSNWDSTPYVNGYGQADFAVNDGTEAAVGASVCRSGSTTGVHCGSIQAKNQTVTYPQGTVFGMTRTNVCAEPGDSGGSWISGGSAQGVTSGGSGNCSSGGTTFFFPLDTILADYTNLTLDTTSGGPGPGPEGCDDTEESYSGSLSGTGDEEFEPNDTYYQSGAGTHVGCLVGPAGTDFDLYLWRWNGSSWQTVASSLSADSEEEITYNGSAGYYAWRVYSYSGSGSYSFGLTRP